MNGFIWHAIDERQDRITDLEHLISRKESIVLGLENIIGDCDRYFGTSDSTRAIRFALAVGLKELDALAKELEEQ